jgi:hypothetical protein
MTDKPETASAPFRVKVRVTAARKWSNGVMWPIGILKEEASRSFGAPAARALRNLGLEVT